MAALQHWRPINSTHAIQQVTAKLRFVQPINDIPWRKIGGAARKAAEAIGLGNETTVEDIEFTLSPRGPQQVAIPTGLEFLRLERPDFYSDKLTVLRHEVGFEEWRYTRWAGFAEKLRATLLPMGELYLHTVPLLGLVLEYIDVFQAAEPDSAPDISEILRSPNSFIPSATFADTEAFHSHSGVFNRADGTTKRLYNVDVDVADSRQHPSAPSLRTVRIRTHITDFFNQPAYDRMPDEAFTSDFIAERFERLHVILKEVLADVLTGEACADVSLKG